MFIGGFPKRPCLDRGTRHTTPRIEALIFREEFARSTAYMAWTSQGDGNWLARTPALQDRTRNEESMRLKPLSKGLVATWTVDLVMELQQPVE